MQFITPGCKNIMSDNQNSIELGKIKIGISYITLFALIVLAISGFIRGVEWGSKIGIASERLARLESTTDERVKKLEKQIEKFEGTSNERIKKLEEQIEKLREESSEQSGDIQAIKVLLEKLLEEKKNVQKNK
jgi:hypothetical protein